jgi:signal transduction histidine kinase
VFTFSLVTRRSGELDYVILVMEDITERRSIKAQLRQA